MRWDDTLRKRTEARAHRVIRPIVAVLIVIGGLLWATPASAAPVAPEVSLPREGTVSREPLNRVLGTAPEDAITVTVRDDDTVICAATVARSSWDCELLTFSEGPHTLTAVATDASGAESPVATRHFTVDSVPPAPPIIDVPADGGATNQMTPRISGTAEPLSTIRLFDENDALVCVGVPADAEGAWSCTSSVRFDVGSHQLSGRAVDAAGNTSSYSEPISFEVDVTPPDAPTGTCTRDAAGTAACSGTAEKASRLGLETLTGDPVCAVTTAAAGEWTCSASLAKDATLLRATATDLAGNTSAAGTVDVIDTGDGGGPGDGGSPGDGGGPDDGGADAGSGSGAASGDTRDTGGTISAAARTSDRVLPARLAYTGTFDLGPVLGSAALAVGVGVALQIVLHRRKTRSASR